MSRGKAFTLIELLIVVVIVAILAASAVPIYRSMVTRAYEAEIVAGLGTFRTAERGYRAEHGVYTDLAGVEAAGLVDAGDFEHMRYVEYGDYTIPSSSDDTYTIQWTRPAEATGRDVADCNDATISMDQGGIITRG